MEKSKSRVVALAVGWASLAPAFAAAAGCADPESITALEPEGPPRILQVFVRERVVVADGAGAETLEVRPELAFGHHDALEEYDGEVTNAAADGSQRIRIVVDELLRGNFLEEIACADGSWSRVPVGTNPTDVARCAGADLGGCKGAHAVCVGAEGPVGILDENHDGAIDDTRFIDGAVVLSCGGVEVALDLQRSYYQPAGNQILPADPYGSLGVDGLGPAVVLGLREGLPTGAMCGISFAVDVVDKDGNRVCAPRDGEVDGECVPGDTSEIAFSVETLAVLESEPAAGAQDVAPSEPGEETAVVSVFFNGALAIPAADSGAVEVRADDVVLTGVTLSVAEDQPFTLLVEIEGGLAPNTDYQLLIRSGADGIADRYGGTMATDAIVTWRTAGEVPSGS